jgi:1-aminocyclopropane-1-carboxylate deaminase/D-cysteine desulfhydrase-like pyridoxal-dependent ACC family enzyme
MADPITILVAASTAMQAVGAIQQGNAANAQAKANAQAAQYNANLKVMQAGVERQQAGAKEEAQRRRSRQMLGAQRAAIAQAGIGLGGSALDIAEQSELMAELDSLTIRYEGELRAKGLLAQADMDRYSADVYKFSGKQAKKDSFMRAGTAVLSGATTYSLAKADLLRIQGTL